MNEWPKGVLKSSDKGPQERRDGKNGRMAEPLYDRNLWGVSFFGAGEPLPGPGLFDKADPKAVAAREKPSERPRGKAAWAEFKIQEEALMPTSERCAW